MSRHVSPSLAAGIGVSAALVIAGVWWSRPRTPVVEPTVESTVAVRISRHDAFGIPSPPVVLRERTKVRALVEALAVDAQPDVPCPPDYATAELGMVLSGGDVYARRNVYLWGLFGDAGSPTVVVVSTSGCRGGPPGDATLVRDLIATAERDASR